MGLVYLSLFKRDLHHEGISQRGTAQDLRASRHFVQNVISDYDAQTPLITARV